MLPITSTLSDLVSGGGDTACDVCGGHRRSDEEEAYHQTYEIVQYDTEEGPAAQFRLCDDVINVDQLPAQSPDHGKETLYT